MNNTTTYICGLPGFGSHGPIGENGERGVSFNIINSNIKSLEEELLESIYNENDIFIYNNDLFLIDKKIINDNPILSYSNLCSNPLSLMVNTDDYNIINGNLILSDKIKTKNQLNDINLISPLTINTKPLNNEYHFINFIDSSLNEMIKFINFNTSTNSYNIGDDITIMNGLYVNDSNILSEKYGISELNKLISSCKFINGKYTFNYKINNNDKFRVTAIQHINNNIIEKLLIDFDDTSTSFNDINDIIFYKVYYLSNINNGNGYLVSQTFKPEEPTVYLKTANVYYDNSSIINTNYTTSINKNNIVISNILTKRDDIITNFYSDDGDDNSITLVLEFTEDSSISVTYNPNLLECIIDNDEHTLKIDISNTNRLYTITVGNVNYNISFNTFTIPIKPRILNFKLREDKNGYLGCNSNYHGVPANGILQVYSLDFFNFDYASSYDISIDIKSSISKHRLNNLLSYKCNIYYAIIKKEKDNNQLDNDTYIYLSDLEGIKPQHITLLNIINNDISENISIQLDKTLLKYYNENDNMSSYKLVIYYEFDDPFYGILNTNISGTINNTRFDTINKSTLMIPWEIIGFAPKYINAEDDYNISIKNIIKCHSITYPQNLTKLRITPEVDNSFMDNYTFKSYKYRGGSKLYNSNNISTLSNIDIYSQESFLEIAYDFRDRGSISYYNEYGGEIRTADASQYSQCLTKYPTWVTTNFDIKIDNSVYQYDASINVPTGTIYSPSTADDFMVDFIPAPIPAYKNYKNHLSNNTFVGFVEWSLHKHIIYNNTTTTSNYIIKYPFVDNQKLQKNDNENDTLYSLYWKIDPRIVPATKSEISYDYAINMLKIPKVYINENKNENYYLKNDTDVKNVFSMMEYKMPFKIYTNKIDNNLYKDFIGIKAPAISTLK